MTTPQSKIIVLDDDPTGSQTVHGCLLLMQWDVETLRLGLMDTSPIVFILTNTRANPPEVAAHIIREVCQNLQLAIAPFPTLKLLIVSRSDSTLRGHYPLETDVINEILGPFDAHFLVPAFFEGGRITLEGVHYVASDSGLTPVHETEFAQDAVFGFQHSDLADYVAEKTHGKIPAAQVQRFSRSDLETGVRSHLLALRNNQCVVVDGQDQRDLDRLATDIWHATQQGKRFLLRSAASLLTSLANLPPQPVAPDAMQQYVQQGRAGVLIVGSHVQKTTTQLEQLLHLPDMVGIEINVAQLREHPEQIDTLGATISEKIAIAHHANLTPVVYTSRQELSFTTPSARLHFGLAVSALLITVTQHLPATIGYIVSKGGNTSHAILSQGLQLSTVRLLGQILPGCCVVQTSAEHPQFPNLPLVLFPGNVGDVQALITVYQRLSGPSAHH